MIAKVKKNAWQQRQSKDYACLESKRLGLPSRSALKLTHLDSKFKLLIKVKAVLDLGAAPGGWSIIAQNKTKGLVIGVDLLNIINPNFVFIKGDYRLSEIQNKISLFLKQHNIVKFDLIMSDMAPNISGCNIRDGSEYANLLAPLEQIFNKYLKEKGKVVIKIMDYKDLDEVVEKLSKSFKKKNIYSLPAPLSRVKSKERYLILQDYL